MRTRPWMSRNGSGSSAPSEMIRIKPSLSTREQAVVARGGLQVGGAADDAADHQLEAPGNGQRLDRIEFQGACQERRHLLTRHPIRRTEMIRTQPTTPRDPRQTQRIDVRLMHTAAVIDEEVLLRRRQTQRPHQERRHLLTRHPIRRTEMIRTQPTTPRDPRQTQRIDVRLMHTAAVIDEEVLLRRRQTQRPHQERRHLLTRHPIRRTEMIRTQPTTLRDAGRGYGFDVGLVDVAVVIDERPARILQLLSGGGRRGRQHERSRHCRHQDRPCQEVPAPAHGARVPARGRPFPGSAH